MPSPSNTELDSSTPDASATPSTSGQPKTGSPIESIEYDPNSPRLQIPSTSGQLTTRSPPSSVENDPINPPSEAPSTSGQPIMRPPLSSIEYDPNNPPPETPTSPNEQVTVSKEYKFYQRVKIQLPTWKQHFHDFKREICIAACITILALATCVAAYLTEKKLFFLSITFLLKIICFPYIWIKIPEGPPFISDQYGNPLKPAYLKAPKLSNSSFDLLPTHLREQLRREEQYLAFLRRDQNS